MYGDGKIAAHPDDAGKFAAAVNSNADERRARFIAAEDLLKKQPTVANDEIATIGYCFGGGVVLNIARDGLDLKGVASFHGSLSTNNPDADKLGAEFKMPLAYNAAADKASWSELEKFLKPVFTK